MDEIPLALLGVGCHDPIIIMIPMLIMLLGMEPFQCLMLPSMPPFVEINVKEITRGAMRRTTVISLSLDSTTPHPSWDSPLSTLASMPLNLPDRTMRQVTLLVDMSNGTKRRRKKKKKRMITAMVRTRNVSKKRNDDNWKKWNIKPWRHEGIGMLVWRMLLRRHFMVVVQVMITTMLHQHRLQMRVPCRSIPTVKQKMQNRMPLPMLQIVQQTVYKEGTFNGTITGCHPNHPRQNIKFPFHSTRPPLIPTPPTMRGQHRSTWATIQPPEAEAACPPASAEMTLQESPIPGGSMYYPSHCERCSRGAMWSRVSISLSMAAMDIAVG
mmetsp:Transcript_18960/g.41062  ORF Transcript_18960/g.41062 Transcript_18960/m.41062 type:complete len:325 (+) Transcript_18960:416-1390(+)